MRISTAPQDRSLALEAIFQLDLQGILRLHYLQRQLISGHSTSIVLPVVLFHEFRVHTLRLRSLEAHEKSIAFESGDFAKICR